MNNTTRNDPITKQVHLFACDLANKVIATLAHGVEEEDIAECEAAINTTRLWLVDLASNTQLAEANHAATDRWRKAVATTEDFERISNEDTAYSEPAKQLRRRSHLLYIPVLLTSPARVNVANCLDHLIEDLASSASAAVGSDIRRAVVDAYYVRVASIVLKTMMKGAGSHE